MPTENAENKLIKDRETEPTIKTKESKKLPRTKTKEKIPIESFVVNVEKILVPDKTQRIT